MSQINPVHAPKPHFIYIAKVVPKDQSRPQYIYPFRNKASFCGDDLLALRPTPKLEDRLLSAVRDCLFNIFAATLRNGGRPSIGNLRTRHVVLTGTHSPWLGTIYHFIVFIPRSTGN